MNTKRTIKETPVLSCLLIYLFTVMFATPVHSSNELPGAELPTYNLPQVCNSIQLNGFTQLVINSQTSERYSPNTDCDISLTVWGKSAIRFTFQMLSMPNVSANGQCQDYVQLFNVVGNQNTPLSPQLCGSQLPATPYLSASNTVLLVFNTDGYQQGLGFSLLYEQVTTSVQQTSQCTNGPCAHSLSNTNLPHLGFVLLLSILALLANNCQ